MGLRGQRVVVLGGTSGIGLAVAEGAAAEGAEVVVASRRQENVDAALKRLPQDARGEVLDTTDEAAVRAFFERLGAFDHLVYTAGETLLLESVAETGLARAQRFLDTRLWGAYAAVKYGAGSVREGGSVVLTTGTAGHRPLPGSSVVSALCGAMEALTRALAVELARYGSTWSRPASSARSCGASCRRRSARGCTRRRPPRCRWAGWASPRTWRRRTCI